MFSPDFAKIDFSEEATFHFLNIMKIEGLYPNEVKKSNPNY